MTNERVPLEFLYVAKRRRERRRERIAMVAFVLLCASILPVLFIIATN